MNEQTASHSSLNKPTNPWLIITLGCLALSVAVYLDSKGIEQRKIIPKWLQEQIDNPDNPKWLQEQIDNGAPNLRLRNLKLAVRLFQQVLDYPTQSKGAFLDFIAGTKSAMKEENIPFLGPLYYSADLIHIMGIIEKPENEYTQDERELLSAYLSLEQLKALPLSVPFSYTMAQLLATLIGYAFLLSIATFAIHLLFKKTARESLTIFSWLFLSAAIVSYLPFSFRTVAASIQSSSSAAPSSTQHKRQITSASKPTVEKIIARWDPKLSLEQRKYRLWMDSLLVFCNSLGEQSALENPSSLGRNIDKLRDAQERIRLAGKNQLHILEKYGPELASTIEDKTRLAHFRSKWRSFTESVAIVYAYDSEAIGHIISSLLFLRNNRSKYYFIDGEMQSDDDEFIQQLATKLSKLDNPEAEVAQQQRRIQAILDYAEALDIARGKD